MKMRFLYIISTLFFFINLKGQNQFSKSQVLKDLHFLKSSLEDAHYNLYAYTSKQEFDKNYEQIKKSIMKDSFNLLEATSILQLVISKANNGHTNIDFPVQPYMEYAYAGGTIFPLEIAFENDKPLIRKNWSGNRNIKISSEILSINGLPMEKILLKINPLISAERPYLKNVKIELYSFPRYYWQAFGKQEKYNVEIISNGKVNKYSLNAINILEDFEKKRTEVLNAKKELKFYGKSAYLNPGDFSGDEDEYQQFIDSAFMIMKENKSKNLILDFRNNSGGDNSFSDYLVSYFADKPFKWNSEFTLKTSDFLKKHVRLHNDTTNAFWQEVLIHKNGKVYDYTFNEYQPQPQKKQFNGRVYVLVNRQSHSQSAVTAAQIQDYKFGVIVGEETGDYPSLFASIFQYSLPNTKIQVNVSKGKIIRVNGSTKEEGVIPDILIKDYLLDDNDEILEGLLKRISNMN